MKNSTLLWNRFAYRHRAWAYVALLATTLLLVAGCLTAAIETLQSDPHILTRGNLAWLLTVLGISTTGAVLMVFAVPSRSPWD